MPPWTPETSHRSGFGRRPGGPPGGPFARIIPHVWITGRRSRQADGSCVSGLTRSVPFQFARGHRPPAGRRHSRVREPKVLPHQSATTISGRSSETASIEAVSNWRVSGKPTVFASLRCGVRARPSTTAVFFSARSVRSPFCNSLSIEAVSERDPDLVVARCRQTGSYPSDRLSLGSSGCGRGVECPRESANATSTDPPRGVCPPPRSRNADRSCAPGLMRPAEARGAWRTDC